jgi:HNH endonuclease
MKTAGFCSMHYARKRRHGTPYALKSKAKKIEIIDKENGCMEVTSHHKLSTGYYSLVYNFQRKLIHRHFYEECFGEIPPGMVVRHKCDNRGCVNPEHLELGTHAENSRDMVERGRSAYGIKHPKAKITDDDVKEIRKLATEGVSHKEIANMYGLRSPGNISAIKYGKSWAHVK